MRLPLLAATAALSAALVSASACGADAGKAPDAAKGDVRATIAKRLDIKVEDVRPSPVPGLYEVTSGSEVGYVSEDGRFYIDGDVYDMQSHANLTEERRSAGRAELLKGIRDEDAVIFAPANYKYTIDVFTDMDCTYCRKLHSEMPELNRLGVRVRYLMYPRNGPGSVAWKKAEAVMCSADRKDALTRAKRGEDVTAKPCDNPVAEEYALGRELGVRGTPGIFTEQGDYITGYMPAARLVEHLKALQDKS